MSKCVVYGLYSSRKPDELRYIGQTTRSTARRLTQHLSYAKKRLTAVQLWISRERLEGYEIVLSVLESEAVFNATEITLIAEHKRSGTRLLNHTDGGEGMLGHSPNSETRLKKSNSARAYWAQQTERVRWRPSEEQKLKISAANKGNKSRLGQKHSEETKKKMREWAAKNPMLLHERNLGYKHTPEAKAKMAEARSAYWEARRG